MTRDRLLSNKKEIEIFDFKTGKSSFKRISREAGSSLSSPKFGQFLTLLCQLLEIEIALETGTSFGLSSLHLAASPTVKKVITLEGNKGIAELAKQITKENSKIEVIEGELFTQFERALQSHDPGLIFLDADHRSASINYCLKAIDQYSPVAKCIVIHDIYWSKDMLRAWHAIAKNSNYTLTIDLFEAGLIFPNLEMQKQHFTIRF